MADVEKMATTVLGPGKEQFYPALLHLVVADSAYCDANKEAEAGQVEGTCMYLGVVLKCVQCVLMHTTLNTYVPKSHIKYQLPHKHSRNPPAMSLSLSFSSAAISPM